MGSEGTESKLGRRQLQGSTGAPIVKAAERRTPIQASAEASLARTVPSNVLISSTFETMPLRV